MKNIILRFIKGMFIGSGFILPGVSGGTLAAIFGVYQKIISFMSNPRKNTKENLKFFTPIMIGYIVSVVLLSYFVSFVLGQYESIVIWFFIGAIVGTFPSLLKEATKQKHSKSDIIFAIIGFVVVATILYFGKSTLFNNVPRNFFTWFISGFLISLGILIPGLSSSNFIVYMGMYKDMSDGFKSLNLNVIIPIFLGMIITVVVLSKTINYILEHYYSKMFHFIIGVVVASTVMIIPTNYQNLNIAIVGACIAVFMAGLLLGRWMCKLEEKYK